MKCPGHTFMLLNLTHFGRKNMELEGKIVHFIPIILIEHNS